MTNPAPETPIPTSPANDQRALFTLCLMAAFADGAKSELERAELSRIANGFADAEFQAAPLYQDVLLKRVSLADAASTLRTPELRNLAYEMAVCVCDADDTLNTAEEKFLRELRAVLRIDARDAGRVEEAAGALATATLPGASGVNPPAV